MSSSNFIGSETELRSVDTVGSPLQWCPTGRWWCVHCAGRNISPFLLLKQLPCLLQIQANILEKDN
jgi:hypothetical protein